MPDLDDFFAFKSTSGDFDKETESTGSSAYRNYTSYTGKKTHSEKELNTKNNASNDKNSGAKADFLAYAAAGVCILILLIVLFS